MFGKSDYRQIIEFNSQLIEALEGQPDRIQRLAEIIADINLEMITKKHFISKSFGDYLGAFDLWSEKSDEIPVSTFLWIYCHVHFGPLTSVVNYNEAINTIHTNVLYQHAQIRDQFEETALQYFIVNKKLLWSSIIENLDYAHWGQIDTSANLLPLSNTSLPEILDWATQIIKTHKNDGALGALHYNIENWVLLSPNGIQDASNNICEIARHSEVSFFLRSFLKGLQAKDPKTLDFYLEKFQNQIEPCNALAIFLGLAQIGVNSETERASYFSLLVKKLDQKRIEASDFFTICGLYGFYEEIVFEKIESELISAENVNTISSISRILQHVPAEIDRKWYIGSLQLIFSKMRPELKHVQNQLLDTIAENDVDLAYDLFEFRMKIMGGNEFLEEGLVQVVSQDVSRFQTKFVQWLVCDDHYIHTGLRFVTFTQRIDSKVFDIPKEIFSLLSVKQKLFAAYKVVGYVYSTEELQQLLISLVRSINVDHEALYESLYFIFSKYLVYNYRGTLELLKKELERNDLSKFAINLFVRIIEEYENYFNASKKISAERELKPYPIQTQLRNFYFGRQFADLPKRTRKNSIASLFKNVSINSHKWEIRRKRGEEHNNNPIHKPQSLGKISVTKEYPAGETLDPVYQEEIRRTYQNIRIDEIRSH